MKFYNIFLIYFLIIFSINASSICNFQDIIYADRGLATINIQLPEKQAKNIQIKIHIPSPQFIGTDFPVIEGTQYLNISTITNQEGRYNFELVFPIRGIYNIEIKDLGSNQFYNCNIEVLEHPEEIKNFYILIDILFVIGFISGIFIFITNKNKIQMKEL